MVNFPNCKINLGLSITRKRDDGFHDLETIFFPVPFTDVLEIIVSDNDFSFTQSGLPIQGAPDQNLCVKAYQLVKEICPELPSVKMHLHKVIPMGAGLGGGSSDGAQTLLLLNKKFRLDLSQQQLLDAALELGSDCPFFVLNQPCFGTGRGEQLSPMDIQLNGFQLLLANPGIHINTGWAFSNITPRSSDIEWKKVATDQPKDWKQYLRNDFEAPVTNKYPVIGNLILDFYDHGASYAAMTGSGSTVFGLFQHAVPDSLLSNLKAGEYWHHSVLL